MVGNAKVCKLQLFVFGQPIGGYRYILAQNFNSHEIDYNSLTVGFLNVSAKGLSQNITFSGKDISLETVFENPEQQTGYFIFYYQVECCLIQNLLLLRLIMNPLNEFLKGFLLVSL